MGDPPRNLASQSARHRPVTWLMTDERMGAALWPALERLPRGAGVVFRHHATAAARRRELFDQVRRITRARRLVLVLAGSRWQALAWGADGVHGLEPEIASRCLLRSAAVHNARELITARRLGIATLFLSPVFATRSHPGARFLGPLRFGTVAHYARGLNLIALGGVDAARFRRLKPLGATGWAGIDAWCPTGQGHQA